MRFTVSRLTLPALPALLLFAATALSCARGSGSGASTDSAATGARAGAVTTHGEWVGIPRGADTIRAYVAYPERSSRAPAVIVIHEIFGLTEWEPTVADRLAGAGFVAIAPDLLSSRFGRTPAASDSGRKLVGQLEPERVTADLDAVYAYVDSLPSVRKGDIGTIGFCWGGGQSFRYATNNPRLKAAVVCYGPAPDSTALAGIQAPVLGIYGENDARINAALPDVERQMAALGKSFEKEIYDSTGHGFLKPGRQGYGTPAVEQAWERITGFYRDKLGR
jgi:carboxymethylenebutenolidase